MVGVFEPGPSGCAGLRGGVEIVLHYAVLLGHGSRAFEGSTEYLNRWLLVISFHPRGKGNGSCWVSTQLSKEYMGFIS